MGRNDFDFRELDDGARGEVRPGRPSQMYRACTPLLILGAAVLFIPLFIWYGCRIEVNPGEFCPLIRKTGQDLTNDMVLAPSLEFKGPQFEILKEGRHFRNPYTWQWPKQRFTATMIPSGKVGILVRRYGEALPKGEVVARTDKQKGIVLEPLMPGRHYINTWAYDVEKVNMVKIEPGHRGVVTLRVGKIPKDPFGFTVERGEQGTQPDLLPPGTHPQHSNPYVHLVTSIDIRSHKLDMSGENSIWFPSKYGFEIQVDGIIEWAPDLEKLPEVFVKFVDAKDLARSGGITNIEQKVILPYARSFFRTIGGSYRAVDYITGDTRVVVQSMVEDRLKQACSAEGITIRSVVIKATTPPPKIRQQYERREIALRLKDRYEKEIEMEIGSVVMVGQTPKLDKNGKPMLNSMGKPVMVGGKAKIGSDGKPVRAGGRLKQVIFKRKKDREEKLGALRQEVVRVIREAEQYSVVEVTKAQKEFEVAKIKLEAAKDRAAATLAKGTAEAAVTVMEYKAEAEGVKAKITAFETGEKYAEYALISRLAPGITEVLSNTEGLFAKLFERFITLTKEAPKKAAGAGR